MTFVPFRTTTAGQPETAAASTGSQPTPTPTPTPGKSRRLGAVTRAAIATLTLASLGGGMLLFAGTAGATTLDAPPTFDCYSGLAATINGGDLRVDALPVADDDATTVWVPVIYRWNGAWSVYATGTKEVFSDGGFGSLTEYPQTFNVPTDSYYAVRIVTVSTGDAAAQDVWAQAMTGGDPIGSAVCSL